MTTPELIARLRRADLLARSGSVDMQEMVAALREMTRRYLFPTCDEADATIFGPEVETLMEELAAYEAIQKAAGEMGWLAAPPTPPPNRRVHD